MDNAALEHGAEEDVRVGYEENMSAATWPAEI
jgi:hypothetical protein